MYIISKFLSTLLLWPPLFKTVSETPQLAEFLKIIGNVQGLLFSFLPLLSWLGGNLVPLRESLPCLAVYNYRLRVHSHHLTHLEPDSRLATRPYRPDRSPRLLSLCCHFLGPGRFPALDAGLSVTTMVQPHHDIFINSHGDGLSVPGLYGESREPAPSFSRPGRAHPTWFGGA